MFYIHHLYCNLMVNSDCMDKGVHYPENFIQVEVLMQEDDYRKTVIHWKIEGEKNFAPLQICTATCFPLCVGSQGISAPLQKMYTLSHTHTQTHHHFPRASGAAATNVGGHLQRPPLGGGSFGA